MVANVSSRRQLTLFVSEPWGSRLDEVRRELDPVQASLIAAHVTLCREDEIGAIDTASLFETVSNWSAGPVCLEFGSPQRFDGHGVLLPCEQGANQFHRLRQWVLQSHNVREQRAHLTLAHPRNARFVGNTDDALADCPRGLQLEFSTVALIEQRDTAPWEVITEQRLGGSGPGAAWHRIQDGLWQGARVQSR